MPEPEFPVVIAPSNNNVEISSSENIQNPNSGFSAFRGKGVAVGGSLGINNGEYSNVSQNSSNQ